MRANRKRRRRASPRSSRRPRRPRATLIRPERSLTSTETRRLQPASNPQGVTSPMRRRSSCALAALFLSAPVIAQHAGHESPPPAGPDPMKAMEAMEPMDHWMTMFHGYAFLNFNHQGGPSGGEEFESQNHFMLVSMRRLWGGKVSLLGTFTL